MDSRGLRLNKGYAIVKGIASNLQLKKNIVEVG